MQGDVVGLIDASGEWVAKYAYNAWGEIISITNANGVAITSSTHIATLNPLRYRGYYYDTETGFYYLQSRYYDPVTHRFINADSYASTGQGFIGTNMFAYCRNNPVSRTDPTGLGDKEDDDGDGDILEVELKGGGGGGSTSRMPSPPTSGSTTTSSPSSPNTSGGYEPPPGGGGVSDTIQVGDTTVEFGHGGRHLDQYNLNIKDVNQALADDVVTKQFPSENSALYNQYLMINGYSIVYNAFMRTGNLINIGTYHVLN